MPRRRRAPRISFQKSWLE